MAHGPSSPLVPTKVLWPQAHHEIALTGNRAARLEGKWEAWGARLPLSQSLHGNPRGLKSTRLLSPWTALLENHGPRRGCPIGQCLVWSTPHPPTCIRVINWRAWSQEWISCLCLASPYQGCPQWGSFTHSNACCRVPGDGTWLNFHHRGNGIQGAWNYRAGWGTWWWTMRSKEAQCWVTCHRRLLAFPTDRAPCQRNELGLEELLSSSEHEVTISEAVNGIWLYDSRYKPIRVKPPSGWHATPCACFLAGSGELIASDAPGECQRWVGGSQHVPELSGWVAYFLAILGHPAIYERTFFFRENIEIIGAEWYKSGLPWGWGCQTPEFSLAWLVSNSDFLLWMLSRVQFFETPWTCSLPGSSVHGILQARILVWVAVPSSRESSWPRSWTQVFRIAGRFFTLWATWESPFPVNRDD